MTARLAGNGKSYTASGGAGWELITAHTISTWPNGNRYLDGALGTAGLSASAAYYNTEGYSRLRATLKLTAATVTPTPSTALYFIESDSAGNDLADIALGFNSGVLSITAAGAWVTFEIGAPTVVSQTATDKLVKQDPKPVGPRTGLGIRMVGTITGAAGLIELWGYRG